MILDESDKARLADIAGSTAVQAIKRARIVLLSAERLSVQEGAQQAGVPSVALAATNWREDVDGLLRHKTRPPGLIGSKPRTTCVSS